MSWFVVRPCPELDIASQGDTIEEACANLEEALGPFLEAASPAKIAHRCHREVYVTHLDVAVANVAVCGTPASRRRAVSSTQPSGG